MLTTLQILVALEQEIEVSLPQFQELLVTLKYVARAKSHRAPLTLSTSHHGQPSKEALNARRRLLDSFAQYDKLSKQIRALQTQGGPGSSQDRVQAAVLARASNFLQKNMFPLQVRSGICSSPNVSHTSHTLKFLPKPSSNGNKETNGTGHSPRANDDLDPDSELAKTLQPLLEQETLLENFIEEAKAQRKFEDVRTLKSNHAEIRREIERVLNGAGLQSSLS